jgi:hypothetical protein
VRRADAQLVRVMRDLQRLQRQHPVPVPVSLPDRAPARPPRPSAA